MVNKTTVDFSKSQKLADAMAKIPSRSEEVINRVLKSRGTREVMESIIHFMPVSRRDKEHAKHSEPLKERMINLGFDIVAKGGAANKRGSFGYLVFPNEGRGSHNPVAQEFFERGLDAKEDMLLDMLVDELVKAQEAALAI